jgi:hypothetical protein
MRPCSLAHTQGRLEVNKLVRDGLVAVLVSPGHGAGWSTWNTEHEEILFDPAIVEFVEHNKWEELEVYVKLKYPDIFIGGMQDLQVEWLPEGTEFIIEEYDGSEKLQVKDDIVWHRA